MLRITFILLAFLPSILQAQCLTANTGAGCATAKIISVPKTTKELGPPPVEIGEILERGKYSMLLNARWYGLPDARDGWVYFRIEEDVYRVDFETMEVLERATSEAGSNWPSG
ncbi:hypothetical protein AB3Y40_09425 [Yoonia sp. R2331]|uniref:hypothetical protein n=1 Tax=Yoonia sp. R2331 TaxID=3237238 RepID=UPI0034E5E1D9